MATINFFIQSRNNPAGIYLRLKEGRTIDAKAKTKYVVNPIEWSKIKGQPKNLKDEHSKKLNDDLTKFKSALVDHYNTSVAKKCIIDTKWLKDYINPPKKPDSIPNKLVDYFDYYALIRKSDIELSTYKKLKVNKKLIERFQEETKRKYFIKDVNAEFKLNFEAYCRKENYAQNTIARTLKYIKTICNHARSNGIETHQQLNSIYGKFEKSEVIYLDLHEIELIEKAELKSDYLINARDWLIISCETGQRVSDFLNFRKDQIRIEGETTLIEFTQIKTKKIMSIPLSSRVKAILAKRDGDFPRKISDQHYNKYIKEVCKIAGIIQKVKGSKKDPKTKRKGTGLFPKYELVTSHIGRRSFASNNFGKIPTPLLRSATGHSSEKLFLEYIGKTDTLKAIQLAEYIK